MVEITDPEVLRRSGQRFHPNVLPSGVPEDVVPGTVFRVPASELAAADAYEVSDYQRVEILLKSGRRAWAYVRA
jgi:hypothetical protein